MNIVRSFANFLENRGYGTFGDDIFIGGAPLEADMCWWIVSGGGSSSIKNQTGERVKNYLISVFYRNIDAEDVYESLQELEEDLNSKECLELEDYETVEVEAISFPADQDLDSEDRTVGLLQVNLRVYQD